MAHKEKSNLWHWTFDSSIFSKIVHFFCINFVHCSLLLLIFLVKFIYKQLLPTRYCEIADDELNAPFFTLTVVIYFNLLSNFYNSTFHVDKGTSTLNTNGLKCSGPFIYSLLIAWRNYAWNVNIVSSLIIGINDTQFT